MATPAADRIAISRTARPLADSQPKKAAPHLIPPKRSCWASTASRATPLLARAPAVLFRKLVSRALVAFGDSGEELVAMCGCLQRRGAVTAAGAPGSGVRGPGSADRRRGATAAG